MEIIPSQVLEPLEKREKRMIVEWPNKEELLKDRDKYLEENTEKTKKRFREHYPYEDEKEFSLLVRCYLESIYLVKVMQKISPLPLEVPIVIIDHFEGGDDFDAAMAVDGVIGENDQIKTLNLHMFPEVIKTMIGFETEKHKFAKMDLFYKGLKFPEAEKIVDEEIKSELDVVFLSYPVEEFAHMLYGQEAIDKDSNSKQLGLEEYHAFLERLKLKMNRKEELTQYYALEMEQRARLWRRAFLKNYFPNSNTLIKAEEEIKIGMERRLDMRRKLEKKEKGDI